MKNLYIYYPIPIEK